MCMYHLSFNILQDLWPFCFDVKHQKNIELANLEETRKLFTLSPVLGCLKRSKSRHDFMGKQAPFLIWQTNQLFFYDTIPFWIFDMQSNFTVKDFPRPFVLQLGYYLLYYSIETKMTQKEQETKWEGSRILNVVLCKA